jgi:2-polyprenyl-6-methoxyphenol hydroxylase-like FAD-dependent oxidoreductase
VYFQRDGAVYANVEPNSDVWARHIDSSASDLPPWIAPAIRASKSLSVSQINSFDAQENVFHGGRVLLIGQACAEIEPYLGKSCDVAAYQIKTLAETLAEQLSGQETWEDCLRNLDSAWGPRTLRYTQQVAAESKSAGRLFRGKSD